MLFLTVLPSPYQRQLFQAIHSTGVVDISAFYYSAGAHDREWEVPALRSFERVMDGRTFASLGPSAHWNPNVMFEIDRIAPDLVVVSDYSALTAQLVMRRLRQRSLPFVFWGELPGFANRGLLGSFVRRKLQAPIAKADAIAGIGKKAVESYRNLFPDKPVYNIPYFCDLLPYRRAREVAAKEKSTIDILFSGQMIPRKGPDILITAFVNIARFHDKLRLVLLGGGTELQKFQSIVPTELKNRVVFKGHTRPSELPKEFAQADIFCLPSRHDGWGVVVNEALGAGLPIVVSDAVGASFDLVTHGQNGFVFPSEDVDMLAYFLGALAKDHHMRKTMSQAALDRAIMWDVNEGALRWQRAAHSVLEATS